MADERRLAQLQSFATIEYGTDTVKFIILNKDGNPINENRSPLEFTYESIFDKQVFTTKVGGKSVQFVNALLKVTDAQFNDLKELTHSVAHWKRTDFMTLMTSVDKNPTRPPSPKELVANSMREWHPEGDILAFISHVDSNNGPQSA